MMNCEGVWEGDETVSFRSTRGSNLGWIPPIKRLAESSKWQDSAVLHGRRKGTHEEGVGEVKAGRPRPTNWLD